MRRFLRLPVIGQFFALVPDGRLDQPAFHAVLEPRQRAGGDGQWSPLGVLHQHVTSGMFDFQQGGFGLELRRRQHVQPH